MAEETTTEATEEVQAAQPQPDTEEQAEAVEQTTEETQETEDSSQPEETQEESPAEDTSDADKLRKWAEAKGLTLDSDNAVKAAQMAREAEKAMHQKAQKASELEKSTKIAEEQVPEDATEQQKDNIRARNLELRMDIRDWKDANPDKVGDEAKMVEVLGDPTKKALLQEGYLSIDDVWKLAAGGDTTRTETAEQNGKTKALKSLAQKQQAAVPTGNATTSETKSKEKPFEELSVKEMEAKLGFARR